MKDKSIDQSNRTLSTKELGKKFLEELQKQGPSYDKMGQSFIARSSKR